MASAFQGGTRRNSTVTKPRFEPKMKAETKWHAKEAQVQNNRVKNGKDPAIDDEG